MQDLQRNMAIILALALAAAATLMLIFYAEFATPEGAFRQAVGICGDGICQGFEEDNCPADCPELPQQGQSGGG